MYHRWLTAVSVDFYRVFVSFHSNFRFLGKFSSRWRLQPTTLADACIAYSNVGVRAEPVTLTPELSKCVHHLNGKWEMGNGVLLELIDSCWYLNGVRCTYHNRINNTPLHESWSALIIRVWWNWTRTLTAFRWRALHLNTIFDGVDLSIRNLS